MTGMHISDIVSEAIFNWTKVGYKKLISQRELTEVQLYDLKTILESTMDGLLIGISAYVVSQQLESKSFTRTKTVVFEVPTTWWQHFKKDHQDSWWAPKWFRNYKKTKMVRDVTFSIQVHPRLLFPQAQVRVPAKFGNPTFVYSTEENIDVNLSTLPPTNSDREK